jgi:hypothetical protein
MKTVAMIHPEVGTIEQTMAKWLVNATADLQSAQELAADKGAGVTRADVDSLLGSDGLVYAGTGTDTALGSSTILVDRTNVSRAKGKVVIALACKAGCKLAPDALRMQVAGLVAFIDELEVILKSPDPYAGAFEACLDSLLAGDDMATVVDKLRDELEQVVQTYDQMVPTWENVAIKCGALINKLSVKDFGSGALP